MAKQKEVKASKMEQAVDELDRVRSDWLKRPGVTAVDIGYRIDGGRLTDEVAVRVHVKRKIPAAAVPPHELFTDRENPEKLGDFPIDVIEAEYAPAHALTTVIEAAAVDRKSAVDPLVGGVSVGNPRISAGTLGAIVWDRTDCSVCILSNWHVLCGSSTCVAGEDIYQPGVYDGGTPSHRVAKLRRWRLESDADAALAKLTGSRSHSRDILELSPIPDVEDAQLGMYVVKSGRTTGLTEGLIDGVGMSVTINYGGGVVQTFHDQIHIVPRPPWPARDEEISRGGDSGSVWINEDTGKAIGLHFAGEKDPAPTAEHAIANQMADVAKELNFSFTPLFCDVDGNNHVDGNNRDEWRHRLRRVLCRYYPWMCFPYRAYGPGFISEVGFDEGQRSRYPPGATYLGLPQVGSASFPPGDIEDLLDDLIAQLGV